MMYFYCKQSNSFLESLEEPETIDLPGDFKEREGDHITLQTKNAIKAQLRDRDEKIHALETENNDLKTKMALLSADNQDVNNESANLDKCVTDMLTAIKFDLDEGPVEGLLVKVSEIYWKNIDKIKRLNDDIKALKKSTKELRERITMFTEENISLKSELTSTQANYATLLSDSTETIASLTEQLKEERAKSNKLQLALRTSSTKSSKQMESMEEELKAAKMSISKMKKEVGVANRERDAAKEELKEINDRTRKLLISLDLLNNCDSTSLSVDHARNIGYARRRRGPNAPPLPAPSEESLALAADLTERIMPDRVLSERGGKGSRELPCLPVTTSPKADSSSNNVVTLPNSKISSSDSSSGTGEKVGGSVNYSRSGTPSEQMGTSMKCRTCGKSYVEASNYEGACLYHQTGATLLNGGTGMEVWSCCKSVDTLKGCLKGRHTKPSTE